MYYVYLAKLKDSSIYTGSTPDLEHRIKKHQQDEVISTRNLRPIKLIWYCGFINRLRALRFEKYLKSGSGQAFRNKRLI